MEKNHNQVHYDFNSKVQWQGSDIAVYPPCCSFADLDTQLVPQVLQEFELHELLPFTVPASLGVREHSLQGMGRAAASDLEERVPTADWDRVETTTEHFQAATSVFTPTVYGLVDHEPALNDTQRKAIHAKLPLQVQQRNWNCVYSTSEHGISIKTLLGNAADLEPLLLTVSNGSAVFGAFLSSALRSSQRYTGERETFVFTFDGVEEGDVTAYHWSERNEYFTLCKPGGGIAVGGGSSGPAVLVHDELITGNSYPCQTFSSPPLVATDEGTGFDIYRVDLYSFKENS